MIVLAVGVNGVSQYVFVCVWPPSSSVTSEVSRGAVTWGSLPVLAAAGHCAVPPEHTVGLAARLVCDVCLACGPLTEAGFLGPGVMSVRL